MTADDMIRIQMTAAGMLMEDISAKVVLDRSTLTGRKSCASLPGS